MNSYETLYSQAKNAIGTIPYEKIFYLRDLIPNPPTGLGVSLYQDVDTKRINNGTYAVICVGKDCQGVNLYKKIKQGELKNE